MRHSNFLKSCTNSPNINVVDVPFKESYVIKMATCEYLAWSANHKNKTCFPYILKLLYSTHQVADTIMFLTRPSVRLCLSAQLL